MSLSKKFYNVEKHDLYQAGYIGAIKALKNYNECDSNEFTTFAIPYIWGTIKNFKKKVKYVYLYI